MKTNHIYLGDCLNILNEIIPDNSIDLIYLDPPFCTGQNWGSFDDKWVWDDRDERLYQELTHSNISNGVIGLSTILGKTNKLSYLLYMIPRIYEMKRVLKSNGSIYLHCDRRVSHSIKLILDIIFGEQNFKNEIIWYYKNASRGKKNYAHAHDSIFWYTKSKSDYTFNLDDILVPYESGMTKWCIENGHRGDKEVPKGKTPDDVYVCPYINAMAKERTGYPTQKPLKLLERFMKASSNEGDIVLDPFCGSGTTCVSAKSLNRRWIGIDVSQEAINTTKSRLDG